MSEGPVRLQGNGFGVVPHLFVDNDKWTQKVWYRLLFQTNLLNRGVYRKFPKRVFNRFRNRLRPASRILAGRSVSPVSGGNRPTPIKCPNFDFYQKSKFGARSLNFET